MRVGIFTDSRGNGISPVIHEHEDTHETFIYPKPGCTLESITPIVRDYHKRGQFEAVYVMVGNNNLTTLDRSSHKIHIEESNPHELYHNFGMSLANFQVKLAQILRGAPVVILPVTPIAINTYNKESSPYKKQWVLDMGITSILGDINIDYRLRHTLDYKRIKDLEREYQLKQLITSPTRITPRHSSIIDMIFTDMEHIHSFGTLNNAISDHLPVFIAKKKGKVVKNISYTEGRSYKQYNKETYQQLIRNDCRWISFWDPTIDPNEQWEIVYETILDASNQLCPIVKMKINENNPQWFSHELLQEIYYKDELYHHFKVTRTSEDWIAFKSQNKLVKALIKNGKEEFIKDTLHENSGDSRKFWRKINDTTSLGKTKIKSTNIQIKTSDGNVLTDQAAAEHVNDYYVNVGPKLEEKFLNNWVLNPQMNRQNRFAITPTSEYEVLKIVKDLKISKSSAYSEISTRLFKDAFEVIIPELAHMYNCCIATSVFPIKWGLAKVIPVPKTGDLSKVENWRPISQIKLPGKILERILHGQLTIFADDFLNKNQHGFRANKSTSTVIFDVMQKLYHK